MNRISHPALLITVLASVASAQSATTTTAAAPLDSRTLLLQQFSSSMQKFVALAEAMPGDRYTWSPKAGVMPVAQVYAHVARYNYYYPATAMGIAAPASIGLDTLERMTNKASIVAVLRQSAEHVRRSVNAVPEAQLAQRTRLYGEDIPQWGVLLQLVAHMNEHLGQSIAYARMNGIVPPWSQ